MADEDGLLLLQLDANIVKLTDKLSKTNSALHDWGQKTQTVLDKVDTRWGRLFGNADPGKALDKIFDRSRLAVLEEGGAKIPIFGAALEALGPAGIAAGVGLVAAATAMQKLQGTLDWADELEIASKRLQTGVEDLQAWRHAFLLNNVAAGEGEAALLNFNAALGRLQDGTAKGALAKYGAALFSHDELESLHNYSDAIPLISTRMQQFGDTTQDAILKAFQIEPLAAVMHQGGDAIQGLLGQARELGIVVNASLVQQAADANEKLKILKEVVGADLTTAFAELAPLIGDVADKLADAARNAAEFFGIAGNGKLIARAAALRQETGNARGVSDRAASGAYDVGDGLFGSAAGYFNRFQDLGVQGIFKPQDAISALYQKLGVDTASLQAAIPGQGGKSPPKPDVHPDLSHHAKAPTDQSAQVDDAANKAMQSAIAGLLAAQIQTLTDQLDLDKQQLAPLSTILADIDQRAELEQQRAQAELKAKEAELDGLEASVRTKLKKGEVSQAAADQAIADYEAARASDEAAALQGKIAVAKKAVLDKTQAQLDYENRAFAQQQVLSGVDTQINSISQGLAVTLAQRRVLAQQQLKADNDNALKGLRNDLDNHKITQGDYDARVSKQADLFGAQQAKSQRDLAGPVEKYLASIQDLNTEFQDAAVHGVDSLSSGLASAIVNAQNLGDVAKNVFLQMAADMISALLKKSIFGPILGAAGAAFGIPHLAAGTNFTSGGPTLIGENGPEVLNLPRGAQVIPNNRIGGMAGGGLYFDLRGAITTADVLDQINQVAAAHGQIAYVRASHDLNRAQRLGARRLG